MVGETPDGLPPIFGRRLLVIECRDELTRGLDAAELLVHCLGEVGEVGERRIPPQHAVHAGPVVGPFDVELSLQPRAHSLQQGQAGAGASASE